MYHFEFYFLRQRLFPVGTENRQRKSLSKIAGNGLGICDEAEIEIRQPNLVQKFNSSTTVEHLTSSRLVANTLLTAVFRPGDKKQLFAKQKNIAPVSVPESRWFKIRV